MLITRKSTLTGKVHTLNIPITDVHIAAWDSGMRIQDAMPDITPDEREFLMTGITPEEWAAAFGGDDD
jgi:hypothetical protein